MGLKTGHGRAGINGNSWQCVKENRCFLKKKSNFRLNKKLHILNDQFHSTVDTCAPISDIPSNISSRVLTLIYSFKKLQENCLLSVLFIPVQISDGKGNKVSFIGKNGSRRNQMPRTDRITYCTNAHRILSTYVYIFIVIKVKEGIICRFSLNHIDFGQNVFIIRIIVFPISLQLSFTLDIDCFASINGLILFS